MQQLTETVEWTTIAVESRGKVVTLPRLCAWHGESPYRFDNTGRTFDARQWTPELRAIKERVETITGTSFDGVLLTLYRDGRDSVWWHSDDEPGLPPTRVIGSVSLGAVRVFEMRHRHHSNLRFAVALPHGSCLVMAGETQTYWEHRVPRADPEVGPRISLTFRNRPTPGVENSAKESTSEYLHGAGKTLVARFSRLPGRGRSPDI
jgi:alkylated DNA repair dioxygenase AlkB